LNRLLFVPARAAALTSMLLGCSSQSLSGSDDGAGTSSTIESAQLTQVYKPVAKVPLSATALSFNPTVEGELWVSLRQFPSGMPCNNDGDPGCNALPGVMGVISGATGDKPVGKIKQDGNAWHFMRRPAAIAWGDGDYFASCGEARTDNWDDEATPYAGPVLWSSNPSVFGVKPLEGQNGTHMDMLHETPYCMGIAHEQANAFWAFNGDAGALDRVDFHMPHQIGGEDHSDGEVHRYVTGQLLRVPEVPSHLAYDTARDLVYVADTGHGRVLSVDPSTAAAGEDIVVYEQLAASGSMDGAKVTELVPPGTIAAPCGMALDGDTLYVTDNTSALIYVLDVTGKQQRVINSGLAAGALAGITVGPDKKLYVTNLADGTVSRVEVP
jgi:hypothetical protein